MDMAAETLLLFIFKVFVFGVFIVGGYILMTANCFLPTKKNSKVHLLHFTA